MDSFLKITGAVAPLKPDFGLSGAVRPSDLENYQAKRKRDGHFDAYGDLQIGAARATINKAFDNDMVTGETVRC